jgi:transglutaminase-like putative cysteine protease
VARTFALAALAGSLIAWNWFRLEEGSSSGAGALVVLLAISPALVRGWRRRIPVAVVAFLLAAGGAFQVSPSLGFPATLGSRFWQGFLEFYEVGLPFDPNVHPWMHGTIVVAVFVFTLLCAIAIAGREPQPAAIALLFGAGWPATLLTGNDVLRGAFLLAGMLVVLVGARGRMRGLQYVPAAIGLVVLAAVALSSSPALAKHGFLDWQKWDFYTRPAKPVSVSYVWNSSYSGFSFPKRKTVVLKIKASPRPHYWRVVPLAGVFAGHWQIDPTSQTLSDEALGEPGLVPAVAKVRQSWVEQRVTVEALRDKLLPAADSPVQFDAGNLGLVQYDPTGIAYLDSGLHRGDTYRVWSFEPQPTPAELARSRPLYPPAIRLQREYLEVEKDVWTPPFGTPDRARTMQQLFASPYPIAAYRPLYRKALRVAGGAKSPYAATVALESWFRTGGGFVYDQHPPQPHGLPALVDFVTRTHRGYCQHVAGAMALMLRYLGVPARVAAGFNSGSYDKGSGEWTVTDHNAHEWVEVWFRGWGWVPFDPTPGSGGLSGGYSSSSKAFDAAAAASVLAGKNGLAQFESRRPELGLPGDPLRLSADVPRTVVPKLKARSSQGVGTPGIVELILLVLAGVVLAIAAAKLVVRRARYLTRDPRRLAAACHREVRDILLDQGIEVPASATPSELAALAERKLEVSVPGLGPHATVARFGPPTAARQAARELRRSMRTLRRGVRRELTGVERARGLVSLRSLGLA